MKRFLTSLLLIGALFGLFGAQMGAARSVPTAIAAPKAMAMDADCMAMMAKQKPAPEKQPCNGLTLDCIAAMGCVVPLVTADFSTDIPQARVYGILGFWPTDTVLIGKSFAPDPAPPTILG
ncbi:hypothetical protein [Novosphingobium sp. HR1a]|uniref:hypothetical protein n=1 Tax=Novosphingobium sp. HR1a TaxID=1395637 RepID=UPI001B3CA338|nr:hypothetical protein [Novosphingobium sp. HR1a]MBF7015733.1 hypothetical protein [Novosphingobium sp. HR1a]MCC4254652.1 hypothetical protein [Sphingobium naphthae]